MISSGARARTRPPQGPLAAALFPLAAAAVMATLGILLFFGPNDSLGAIAALAGMALVVTGVLRLVRGAAADGGTHRGTHVLIGLLAVLAGLFCLGRMELTAIGLSLVVGLFWVMHGLVDLAASGTPGRGRVLAVITGGLSMLAGGILIFWPAITVRVLAAVMAIWFGCDGALIAVAAAYLGQVTAGRITAGRAGVPARPRPGGTGRPASGTPSAGGS